MAMVSSRRPFDAEAFLNSAGLSKTIVEYQPADLIFSQGDRCESVMYIRKGGVKLSVLSKMGREAVVAMLGPGDFFGEGCLAGQPVRIGSAIAHMPTSVLVIQKKRMIGVLHRHHALSNRFIDYDGNLDAGVRVNSSLLGVILHD